jgi:ABC-2 type transport system ATP-binding protein
MNPIVRCSGVSKRFQWHEKNLSLKKVFAHAFRRPGPGQDWELLSNVNFEIEPGEKVGIIGRNGSGKTSLLRLIAGIYAPTSGTIEVNAKRSLALLELGVGFYADLSGRENIRLNWVFHGLSLAELSRKFDDITGFSGVGRFLDTPLKFYSSGMKARLGFSIAVHADPDLLMVDEVLAVGDAEFQGKCRERMSQLCSEGTTLLLVSHNHQDVEEMCDRVIWLNAGSIAYDGPPHLGVQQYMETSA